MEVSLNNEHVLLIKQCKHKHHSEKIVAIKPCLLLLVEYTKKRFDRIHCILVDE